jgi:hypothetical protein
MQKGHHLQFECQSCKHPVTFSLFELHTQPLVPCPTCQKPYHFDDPKLIRQLTKFEALCRQIRESEEILGSTNVGVDVEGKQIKIPFKILLTRLSSCLDLMINGKPFVISFRFEPLSNLPKS